MPVPSSKSKNAAFRRAVVLITSFKNSKCNKHRNVSFQTHAVLARGDADYGEGFPARTRARRTRARTSYPTTRTQMRAFLRVTNACRCLVMMTYTNIQRIAFLFHYFFHTKLIPKPPGLLLSSLHHHYIRPPASAAPLTRKLPTMCFLSRRPPEKETLVWRLLAFVPPFSGLYN